MSTTVQTLYVPGTNQGLSFPRWGDENALDHPKTKHPAGPSSPSRVPVRSKTTTTTPLTTDFSFNAVRSPKSRSRRASTSSYDSARTGAMARKSSIPFPKNGKPAPPVVTTAQYAPILDAVTSLLNGRARTQSLPSLGRRERPSVVAKARDMAKEAAAQREREATERLEKEKAEKLARREEEAAVSLWSTLQDREKVVIGHTMDRGREYRNSALRIQC